MKNLLLIFTIVLFGACTKKQTSTTAKTNTNPPNTGTTIISTITSIMGLNGPTGMQNGVTVDGTGNVYIAASYTNSVIKVDLSGNISTIAGNGTQGYSGDGGQATSGELYQPTGVAIDGNGNIYIADYGNNRVRKVNTSGVISTFAGNGIQGYAGDGGQATACELYWPRSIAVDANANVYIGNTSNNTIRKVNTSGIISTVASQIDAPIGLAVDKNGNIYFSQPDDYTIRKEDIAGNISTIAGNGNHGYSGDGGQATSCELNVPYGVAVDSAGNVYIADMNNNRIRKINTSGIISTIAGGGTSELANGEAATNADLVSPTGITTDSKGNIYIAYSSNGGNYISKISN